MDTAGLGSLDDPKIWEKRLAETSVDTMLVGHLPHLSRLAGRLLHGDEGEVIAFKKGSIVCLEKDMSGRWTLQWMVTPEVVS